VIAPVRVVAVDVTAPLTGIESGAGRYRFARIFAFSDGVPLGEMQVELPPEGLPPDRLGGLLSRAGLSAPPVAEVGTGAEHDVPPARLAHPQAPDPLISVVVATDLARPAALARCLDALARQDHPNYDVVVVANGSAQTQQMPALPPMAQLVVERRRGASLARNRGFAESAGTIVAFTDDDAAPASGWLRAISARFAAEPDAGCVTGLVLPGELETEAQVWFESSTNAFHQSYRPASFAGGPFEVADRLADDPTLRRPVYAMGPFGTGCNVAFRRDVLDGLGGFDPALGPGTVARAGEDLLLLLRLLAGGGRLAYEPSAVVWHWHRAEALQLRRQATGFGRGFTAMLTAAVLNDPRHLHGLVRMRRGGADASSTGSGAVTPSWLGRARRLGELSGPLAYLAARLRIHW
jgi:GT2 family glycosyltransferase